MNTDEKHIKLQNTTDEKPLFSVLMANYNNERFIKTAIESVLKQTFKDWELIIIDDASQDKSAEVISSYLSDRRIKFFSNEKNLGYIKTLKKMLAFASAPIVGILDSDDALAETAIAEVMSIYESHADVGMVYTQHWRCDENLNIIRPGFSSDIPPGLTNLHNNSVHCFRTFCTGVYRKTAGYDELMQNAEDLDLVLKMEEVTKLHFIDKKLYYYRILPKSQTHGFVNLFISRSSAALAKYRAYTRRLNLTLPNLNIDEVITTLFIGLISSLLCLRFRRAKFFLFNLFRTSPLFFLNVNFYANLIRKIKKIRSIELNVFK